MKHATYTLIALIAGTAALSAATTTIIDTSFKNGTYNSNGGFEYQSDGTTLVPVGTTGVNDLGLWSGGDASALPGIDRATVSTRAGGIETQGTVSTLAGDYGANGELGATLNTQYVVQTGDSFNLSFDFTGYEISTLIWDSDDNLQVALFTSSDDTLGGTLTQIWAGSYLDTNLATANAFQTITESGIGTIDPASVGQDLWITFSAGNAGTISNDFAALDNVGLTAIPEPSAYALLGGFLALGLAATRRRIR